MLSWQSLAERGLQSDKTCFVGDVSLSLRVCMLICDGKIRRYILTWARMYAISSRSGTPAAWQGAVTQPGYQVLPAYLRGVRGQLLNSCM
jgi:hypothetical protein